MLIRLLPGVVIGMGMALLVQPQFVQSEPVQPQPVQIVQPAESMPQAMQQPVRWEADLSERVLFSAERSVARAKWDASLIPSMREMGFEDFDEEEEVVVAERVLERVVPEAAASFPAVAEASRGGASESAYASLAAPDFYGNPAIPSGDLPPLMLEAAATGGAAALSLPARKGLRARAGAEALRARRDSSFLDPAAYSMTGTKYSVGLDCDWNVDTTIGLSLDLLDASVKSARPYDARATDMRGVFAGVSVDSVLFDSYLLGLKGFYGRLDSRGEGSIASPDNGGATSSLWREPEHRSDMYGLSAAVRVPALFGDYRVVFDSGVSYTGIETAAHRYRVDVSGRDDVLVDGFSSASFALPAGVSVERDFITPWALITPRLGAGTSYEFSDTANGVRSLNALSAMPMHLQADGFHTASLGFSPALKMMHHVNLGLDVATTGGWNMRVDYRHDFSGAYRKDTFSAELGRNF